MRCSYKLMGLLLAGIMAAAVPTIGCATSGRGYVAVQYEDPPPPAREEVVVYRPGYFWVNGAWIRDAGDRWRWRSGYYERERAGYVYVPGRWERRGGRYIWIDGGWRGRGGVVIRGRGRF